MGRAAENDTATDDTTEADVAADGGAPDSDLEALIALVKSRTGYDFRPYKSRTLSRRASRRMALARACSVAEYCAFLGSHPAEVDALVGDLLIGVTSFFRTPAAWESLMAEVLAPMVAAKPVGGAVRVWIPGCASGEEAYSLAVCLSEAIAREEASSGPKELRLHVFATDVNPRSLRTARAGFYDAAAVKGISPERLERYFVAEKGGYRVAKDLRDAVVFARHDLKCDPPFCKIDLVSCRNLLIYLRPEAQHDVLSKFEFALGGSGHLFLGSSESVLWGPPTFETVSKRWRIFRAVGRNPRGAAPPLRPPDAPAETPRPTVAAAARGDLGVRAGKAAADEATVPYAVVRASGSLVYRSPAAYPFVSEDPGARPHFSADVLAGAAERSVRGEGRVSVGDASAGPGFLLRPFTDGPDKDLFLVVFEPGRPGSGGSEVSDLERELGTTRRDLHSAIEALESANHELKASAEEAMSMNEELQASNEEIEASREELQSLNEELITVNGQLREKVFEVEATRSDLENLLSSTRIATVFLDKEAHIRRFTGEAVELFNLIPTDVGRPIRHLVHKFTDADLLEDAERVMKTLLPAERQVRTEDGRWFMRRILPYRTGENRIEGVVATFTDVTSLESATQRLRRREREQAVITELGRAALSGRPYEELARTAVSEVASTLGAAWVHLLGRRADGKGMVVEAAAGRPSGMSRSEAVCVDERSDVGRALLSGSPVVWGAGGDGSVVAPGLRISEAVAGGICVVVRWADGPAGCLAVHAADAGRPLSADDAPFLQAVAHVLSESAKRQHVETELRERERTAKERAEELTAVTEAAPVAVLVAGGDSRTPATGRRVRGNDEAYRMLRRTAGSDLAYSGEGYRFLKNGRALTADETPLVRCMTHGGRVLGEELDLESDDGARSSVLANAAPLFDQEGRPRGAVCVLVDVTEGKAWTARLQEADRRKDEFLAMLAHELRNPLAAISGALSVVKIDSAPLTLAWANEVMERQTRHLVKMIDELLDVSRITRGRIELSLETIDLGDVVKRSVGTVRNLFEQFRHSLRVDTPPRPVVIWGDPTRLEQIVVNLLTNAAKYTPAHGRIEVSLREEGGDAVVTVTDNGVGMEPAVLAKVFDLFGQADVTIDRARGGLGIGLTLVRKLAELHGGSVTAESEGREKGSKFTVRLPLCDVPERTGETETRAGAGAAVRKRLLVVDDNKDAAEALASFLELIGGEVLVAYDGPSALEAARQFRPDVILLDIGLPGIDGYLVASTLKSEPGFDDTRIMAVSGYGQKRDRDRSRESGFDHHFVKPINYDELVSVLGGH